MCNKRNSVDIDIKITDTVLTPLTCAFLVNEVIKFLVYQKSQIPYPYNWLQTVITRKHKNADADNVRQGNITVARHYNVVSTVYNAIEEIMSNVKTEFRNCANSIKEVVIIFGATPYTPKEVFRINLPSMEVNHIEANHCSSTQKKQKILRHIFLSQDWLKAMDYSCPTTNMYVMLRKSTPEINNRDNFFIPVTNYSVPSNFACVTINLDYQNERDHVCCSNISVYNDSSSTHYYNDIKDSKISSNSEESWYQAKLLVKGYKDCFINKVSASELF